MQERRIWTICLLLLGVLAAGTPLCAQAEEEGGAPMYIYVSQWAVPRAQWREVAKRNDADRPMMEKLMADGTITGYGEFTNLIHVEGEPTHGDWITATSEGNILKALETFYAQPDVTAPVLAASKHWDYFLVSRTHNQRSGTFDGAYLAGSRWRVKPGQGRAFGDLVKRRLVPDFEKLLADGVLLFYTVDAEDFHTQDPGVVEIVFATADASGMDKVSQVLEASFGKVPETALALALLTEREGHRDFLARITQMKSK